MDYVSAMSYSFLEKNFAAQKKACDKAEVSSTHLNPITGPHLCSIFLWRKWRQCPTSIGIRARGTPC